MPDLTSMTETIAFPLWGAAAAAAIMALLAILAILRIGGRQVLALLVAAVFVMGIGWLVLGRLDTQEKLDRRRAIEARIVALSAQAAARERAAEQVEQLGVDRVRVGRGRGGVRRGLAHGGEFNRTAGPVHGGYAARRQARSR